MRPDFTKINFRDLKAPSNKESVSNLWETPEHISIKSNYGKEDLEQMEHLRYAAGFP